MRLAQYDHMVEAFASDRSDQPLGIAILPRRRWGDGLVPDTHSMQSTCDDGAIDAIRIADQVARSLIPGKCLGELTCDPFGGRICCDVDPD